MQSQFGIRTLLLMVACAATWVAYFSAERSIVADRTAIEKLHFYAPELEIRGSDEYSALQIDRAGSTKEFHCYLPPGPGYVLNLKWQEAFSFDSPKNPDLQWPLRPGTYRIKFEVGEQLKVLVDDNLVTAVHNPYSEISGNGFRTATNYQERSTTVVHSNQWKSVQSPLILLCRQWGKRFTKLDNGIALWIERNNHAQE